MFSFLKKQKMVVDATPHMRRVIDLTTPGYLRSEESRYSRRYLRALATAIWPWTKNNTDPERLCLGITRDVSDTGVCILTTEALDTPEIALTFLVETDNETTLSFFRATVIRESRLGSFFEYGVHIEEYLNHNYGAEIKALDEIIRVSFADEFANVGASDANPHPKYTG